MLSTPYLALENVSCERNGRLLIDRLSLVMELGQALQVEGPNGSGKTTLLRVLNTLSRDYHGQIRWQGQDLAEVRADYLRQLLYIGHAPGIKRVLTPLENLRWQAELYGDHKEQDMLEALARVGLVGCENTACHHLSAGQQRRVSLAKLFLFTTPLWILDEPFTAIDKQGVAELEAVIDRHVQDGGLVILTTHHSLSLKHGCRRLSLGGGA